MRERGFEAGQDAMLFSHPFFFFLSFFFFLPPSVFLHFQTPLPDRVNLAGEKSYRFARVWGCWGRGFCIHRDVSVYRRKEKVFIVFLFSRLFLAL